MTTLVTGARGNLARRVIDQLRAAGTEVRAASRQPEGTALPPGVEPVRLDFTDPDTLAPALEGVDTAFVYAAHEGMPEFAAEAKRAGVSKVVLLSSLTTAFPGAESDPIARWHLLAEQALESSGLNWVFVRPAMFATNTLWWASSIRDEGVARVVYPDAPVNPIHDWDIADVALLGLTGDTLDGQKVPIDGPGHLTQRRQVELIAEAVGSPIRLEELPREVAAKFMPEKLLDMLATAETYTHGPTSEAATGVPARDFAQWTRDHAADFR